MKEEKHMYFFFHFTFMDYIVLIDYIKPQSTDIWGYYVTKC